MAFSLAAAGRRVPTRVVGISLLSLVAAVAGNVLLSQTAREYAMLPWLLALVPAFLLAYYRGWKGAAVALELGMLALVATELFILMTGTPFYDSHWFAVILLVFIGVTFAIGQVTELLHRQKLLAEKNAFEVVTMVDQDGTIVHISPSVERILGYDPREAMGRSVVELVHPDDLPQLRQTFEDRAPGPDDVEVVDLRIRHDDGSWRVLESRGRNLLHDPQVGAILVSSRDVTAQRELQDMVFRSQRLESVGRLTGGIAHDFNNILTAISAHAEFLLEKLELTDPKRREVQALLAAGQRARDLAQQLLAFSRQQVLHPRPVDIDELAREILQMLRRTIRENVVFDWQKDPTLSSVLADPTHLRQILINLVVNAGEAMPDGGTLTIRARNRSFDETGAQGLGDELPPGDYVELIVSDTGVGIEADVMEKIFEPFFSTKESGTGLGLATVYGIVKQSGGHIRASSQPGEGTTIALWLPATGEPVKPTKQITPLDDTAELFRGRILVVEDDAAVRAITERILTRRGCDVVTADEAESALDILKSSDVALLLTDVIMPGMSGVELARRARQIRPDLRILLTSGYARAELEDTTALEDCGFLQKPFTPAELLAAVHESGTPASL